jgi:hypothetical protein
MIVPEQVAKPFDSTKWCIDRQNGKADAGNIKKAVADSF